MNYTKTILAAVALTFGAGIASSQNPAFNQESIAVAGSVNPESIPKHARSYIHKYFHNQQVVEVEKEFLSDEYEVKLSSGTELTFNKKGDIQEIDAADNAVIPTDIVKAFLPRTAYKALEKFNFAKFIDNLKKTKKGYVADVDDAFDTEVSFNPYGELVSISVD